jgi:hypothetical protein
MDESELCVSNDFDVVMVHLSDCHADDVILIAINNLLLTSPQHWLRATFKDGVTVSDFGIVVNRSDASYCPKLIGFTIYDAEGRVLHNGRHNFSLSSRQPKVRSSFFLCVMKGNQSADVRSIKINIFRCLDNGCDCMVTGIIARRSATDDSPTSSLSHAIDTHISCAIREVLAGFTDHGSLLCKLFAHVELFTNPSIVSRGITPVKSQTVESSHPASLNGGTFIHNICFPGAIKLTVKFDKRSGKGSGHSGIAVLKVKSHSQS